MFMQYHKNSFLRYIILLYTFDNVWTSSGTWLAATYLLPKVLEARQISGQWHLVARLTG